MNPASAEGVGVRRILLHLLALAAVVAQTCDSLAAESGVAREELDQVQVYGSRQHLTDLRRAVVEAEDRFYKRYNDLNSNDAFDMECRREVRTGTRLQGRQCRPVYQARVLQEGGKEGLEIRQRFQSELRGVMPRSPPVPPAIAIEARRPEFQQHMREVVSGSRELTLLLQERAAAAERLEAAMRRARGAPCQAPSATEGQQTSEIQC